MFNWFKKEEVKQEETKKGPRNDDFVIAAYLTTIVDQGVEVVLKGKREVIDYDYSGETFKNYIEARYPSEFSGTLYSIIQSDDIKFLIREGFIPFKRPDSAIEEIIRELKRRGLDELEELFREKWKKDNNLDGLTYKTRCKFTLVEGSVHTSREVLIEEGK